MRTKHQFLLVAVLVLASTQALHAQTITEFTQGISPGARPLAIVIGSDGNLWFTESGIDRIGRITPLGVTTEFAAGITSDARPSGITLGADGNVWFTETGIGRIARITPAGVVTEFGEGMPPDAQPFGIARTSDGMIWFTDLASNRIGRITPSGTINVFTSGRAQVRPFDMTRGPDGVAWFTQHHAPNEKPSTSTSIARVDAAGLVTEFVTDVSEMDAITTGPNVDLWSTRSGLGAGGQVALRMTTSGAVTIFKTGQGGSPFGSGIVLGADGNLWMADLGTPHLSSAGEADRLVRISPAGDTRIFPFGKYGRPAKIAASPDGSLWATKLGRNRVLRVALSGTVEEFSAGIKFSDFAVSITAGPQSSMWFVLSGNQIGRVASDGSSAIFPLPGTQQVNDIAAGPDGNLWFTDIQGHIGRLRPNGEVTLFNTIGAPNGIVAGPDGAMWFTKANDGIGRITINGTITEFSAGITPGAGSFDITLGADGNIWFTERNAIARISPSGDVTEFPIGGSRYPRGIASGPDGNVWFTAFSANGGQIGRVTPSGAITYFDAGANATLAGIAAGGDGHLWFADLNYRIGRVDMDGSIAYFDAGAPGVPTRLTSGPDGNLWITLYNGDRIVRATTETRAFEFYNASLDHYFYSWVPDEIGKLDAGTEIKGWKRTGGSFKVYTLDQQNSAAVCRFYIPPGSGDSHFFGRSTEECNNVRKRFPNLVIEDWTFMQMFIPETGVCAADTVPIYRMYNNRSDINHRYTSDRSVRDAMVGKGWIPEGDGPDIVTMCGPT